MTVLGNDLGRTESKTAVIALTCALAGLSVAVWIQPPSTQSELIVELGFIPRRFSQHHWASLHTLVTATALHSDVFHLAGNVLFLWVFGRTLARLFGNWLLLVLFPLLGAVGFLASWLLQANSPIPIIGASAAVSTLMGAYLVLFPRARLRYLIVSKRLTSPAWAFLIIWLGLQFLSLLSGGEAEDGVAYSAHIGGFVLGAVCALCWKELYTGADDILQGIVKEV